jgi:hypothetical protein
MLNDTYVCERTRLKGYGALFAVVVAIFLLVSAGLVNSKLTQVQDVKMAKTEKNTAQSSAASADAWEKATSYFKSQVDANIPIAVGTSTSGNMAVAADPNSLNGVNQSMGNYSATIAAKNGNNYWVNLVTNINDDKTITKKLFNYVAEPAYNCSIVENQVFSGNLDKISHADLIKYAQSNCGVISPKSQPLADTNEESITYGTSSATCIGSVYNVPAGSGFFDLVNLSGCTVNIASNYDELRFLNNANNSTLNSTVMNNRLIMGSNLNSSTLNLFGAGYKQKILADQLNSTSIKGETAGGIYVKINTNPI